MKERISIEAGDGGVGVDEGEQNAQSRNMLERLTLCHTERAQSMAFKHVYFHLAADASW